MAEMAYEPRPRTTARIDGKALFQRYGTLVEQRRLFEWDWQDCVNYMLPSCDDILGYRSPGQSRTEFIYDSSLMMPPQHLAASMMGAVTNSAVQWFKMSFRLQELNEIQYVAQWLEACTEIQLAAYNASNFYQAAHTYYLHLGVFGTAAMFVSARRGEVGLFLEFQTLQPGSYVIAENHMGRVDTLMRELWLTPRQAVQRFGEGVSAKTMEYLKNPQTQDRPERYLHAVYPRETRRAESPRNTDMRFVSCYAHYETQEVVQESGFPEFPFLVSRWETMGRTPYGFGPGHMALPDVRTANGLVQLNMEQLTLWARPPLKVIKEGVIGAISLQPYALNQMARGEDLTPLELTGRPDLVQINLADLRNTVNNIFFVNALQALPQPGETPQMTAFEVARRIEQMQRLMGPAFHRLLVEMLDPLADRAFGLLLRMGALPDPPIEVLYAAQQAQGQLDIEYEGPLARSQRGADYDAIAQGILLGGQVVEATGNPQIWDNVDLDAAFRHALEVGGMPRHLLLDARDVVLMRQARAQAQAQQMQAAEGRANLEAVGRVAPVIQAFQQQQQAVPVAA